MKLKCDLINTHLKNSNGCRRDFILKKIHDTEYKGLPLTIERSPTTENKNPKLVVCNTENEIIGEIKKSDNINVTKLLDIYGNSLEIALNKITPKGDEKYSCIVQISTPPQPINFVAIDFETANYSRCSACSLGIAIVKDGKVDGTYSSLIKPPIGHDHFESKFIDLHRITPGKVENAPSFKDIWQDIHPIIDRTVLVAHNMPFDCSVLSETLNYYGLQRPMSKTLCSLSISRLAWPEIGSHKLSNVAGHLAIELNHHNAESDAIAAAEIILKACDEYNAEDLDDLLEILNYEYGYINERTEWCPYIKASNVNGKWSNNQWDKNRIDNKKKIGVWKYILYAFILYGILRILVG